MHWKKECPALKAKERFAGSFQVKPVAMAASETSGQLVGPEECQIDPITQRLFQMAVSLPGRMKVAVKILRHWSKAQF